MTAARDAVAVPEQTTALEPLSGTPALHGEWAELANRCSASPFLDPDVVTAWAEAYALPLELATVRRGGALVAALPLVRRGRRLVSAANWHLVETGLLADDAAAAEALARALPAGGRRVTLALLDPASAATLRWGAAAAGCRVEEEVAVRSPYLPLDGDWEAYEAALPSRRRSELRRLRRRLGELGAVTLEVVDGGAGSIERPFDELLALEATGWKRERGTAIAQSTADARFYRSLARVSARRGWARFHVLRLDGRAVAVSFGLQARGAFYGLKIGFDPELRKHGPGRLLLYDVVRDAFEQRLERFEMLGDADAYKREWCPETRDRVNLDVFRPGAGGRLDHLVARYGPAAARRLRMPGLARRLRRGDPLAS